MSIYAAARLDLIDRGQIATRVRARTAGLMELELSRHAIARMIGQGISEEMIQGVINNPRWMPVVGPNTCYDGIVGDGRRLRVVLAEEHSVPVLVTAHWVDRD